MDNVAYISLGSNLGDSPGYLREALNRLARIGTPVANSDFYRSLPWGNTNQPDFYNAVAAIDMGKRGDPQRLLYALTAIEAEYDRARVERWGPRTLDIDLLLYGDIVEHTRDCTVPHPHMRERGFVLAPLVEIAPDLRLPPDGAAAKDLLNNLPASERAGVARLRGTAHLPAARQIDYDDAAGPGPQYSAMRPLSEFDHRIFDATLTAMRFGPKMRVLDVGCGTGRFTRLLGERGADVTGVDRSEIMLEQARAQTDGGNPKYVRVDAVDQLPGRAWDAITAFFSIHHFSSIDRFLLLAKQHLAPGGTLAIASFPHRHFIESPFADFFPSFAGIDLARFPSAPAVVRMLRQTGFADIEERELTGQVTQDYATLEDLVRNKYVSTFHLLDEREFQAGLASMHAAWSHKADITRPLRAIVVSGRRP